MGIKDEFHQKAILSSVDELRSGEPTTEPPVATAHVDAPPHMGDGITIQAPPAGTLSPQSSLPQDDLLSVDQPVGVAPSSTTMAGFSGDGVTAAVAAAHFEHSYHRLTQYSFSQLEKCDKCKKNLRGLMHQGLICSACSFKTHRTCCVTGLPPCYGEVLQPATYTLSQASHSKFGCALNTLFDVTDKPAPDIVIMCVTELENQATKSNLDLYKTYRYTASSEEVQSLKDAFEKDFASTALGNFPAQQIATVLKKFLRELPDPVIPVKFYDAFIEASSEFLHQLPAEKFILFRNFLCTFRKKSR